MSNSANDQRQLQPGLEAAQQCTQQPVETMIADTGYPNRDHVEQPKKPASTPKTANTSDSATL